MMAKPALLFTSKPQAGHRDCKHLPSLLAYISLKISRHIQTELCFMIDIANFCNRWWSVSIGNVPLHLKYCSFSPPGENAYMLCHIEIAYCEVEEGIIWRLIMASWHLSHSLSQTYAVVSISYEQGTGFPESTSDGFWGGQDWRLECWLQGCCNSA